MLLLAEQINIRGELSLPPRCRKLLQSIGSTHEFLFLGRERPEVERQRPPELGVKFFVPIDAIQAASLKLGDHLRPEQQNKRRRLEAQQHDYRCRQ